MARILSLPLSATILLAGAVLGFSVIPASAQFVLIENFDDVALGADLSAANPGENFTTNGNGALTNILMVRQDATNPANQLLAVEPSVLNLFGFVPFTPQAGGATLTLAQGATGTIYFRIRHSATGTINYNLGLSDVAVPNATGSFESQLNFQSTAFAVRDAGIFSTTQGVFTPDDWFGVFMVVDNLADTTKFYIQPSADSAPTLLTSTDSPYGFRNGTATNALTSFLIYEQANGNPLFVDDIYFDPTGENLAAPTVVPEPGSMSLICGAAGALLGFLRKRRLIA